MGELETDFISALLSGKYTRKKLQDFICQNPTASTASKINYALKVHKILIAAQALNAGEGDDE